LASPDLLMDKYFGLPVSWSHTQVCEIKMKNVLL